MDAVSDRLRIESLFYKYGEALDDRDWSIFDEIFADDIVSDWFGKAQHIGRESVSNYIIKIFGSLKASHHLFGNFKVAIDGDIASASMSCRAYHIGTTGETEAFVETMVIYSFDFVRGADGWRIMRLAEKLYALTGDPSIFRGSVAHRSNDAA